jgi:hypothetical protein
MNKIKLSHGHNQEHTEAKLLSQKDLKLRNKDKEGKYYNLLFFLSSFVMEFYRLPIISSHHIQICLFSHFSFLAHDYFIGFYENLEISKHLCDIYLL